MKAKIAVSMILLPFFMTQNAEATNSNDAVSPEEQRIMRQLSPVQNVRRTSYISGAIRPVSPSSTSRSPVAGIVFTLTSTPPPQQSPTATLSPSVSLSSSFSLYPGSSVFTLLSSSDSLPSSMPEEKHIVLDDKTDVTTIAEEINGQLNPKDRVLTIEITKLFDESKISQLEGIIFQPKTEITLNPDITMPQREAIARIAGAFKNVTTFIYSPVFSADPLLNAITNDNFSSLATLTFIGISNRHMSFFESFFNKPDLPKTLKILNPIYDCSEDPEDEDKEKQFIEYLKDAFHKAKGKTLPNDCQLVF